MLVAVKFQPFVDPVGEPQQRQFAQRREIAFAKIAGQGRIDLVGGVDVAVGHPAAQRMRAHVHEFDRIGLADHFVRHSLALAGAGDRFDDVVERFEVLNVDRGDDADAGVEEFLDVLPALFVFGAGDVGVGEFVNECDAGFARKDCRQVHLGLHRVAIVKCATGDDFEVGDLVLGMGAVVGLDEAHDYIRAATGAALTFVEHRKGLADSRRGAEIDP